LQKHTTSWNAVAHTRNKMGYKCARADFLAVLLLHQKCACSSGSVWGLRTQRRRERRRLLWQVRSLGTTTVGTFPKADTMDALGAFLGTSSWTTRNVSGNVSGNVQEDNL
jgi:hypothetical protein